MKRGMLPDVGGRLMHNAKGFHVDVELQTINNRKHAWITVIGPPGWERDMSDLIKFMAFFMDTEAMIVEAQDWRK